MKNTQNSTLYDLAVIGNGIAAQSFLWNLSNRFEESVSISQNFSIAHIHSEKKAPACSLRSSATVSLNGIEEDVSPLGNDMREAFFMFDELVKKYRPNGVEEVTRTVVSTNEADTKKITRRYKTLNEVKSDKIKKIYPGVEYSSYVITPDVFLNWLKENSSTPVTDIPLFAKNMEMREGEYFITLEDGNILRAKKVLFAMGAYSKIFEKMLMEEGGQSHESKNTIKAGSYLERTIHLGNSSFYLSIDGHQVLYRKNAHESKLIIGSATTVGAYEAPDLVVLNNIFKKMKDVTALELGEISDYKIVTGLRHKGPKRLLISEAMDDNKSLYRINGLYKNGYTLGFLASYKMMKIIFS